MRVGIRARWSGAALAGLLAVAGTVSAATQLKGAEAPDFVLKSFAGKNLRLSEYRGVWLTAMAGTGISALIGTVMHVALSRGRGWPAAAAAQPTE